MTDHRTLNTDTVPRTTSSIRSTTGQTCPSWCTTDHKEYVLDGGDPLEHWGPSRDVRLTTLRKYIDDQVERDGGGSYDLTVGQRSMENGGYEGPVTVDLLFTDLEFQRVIVRLTSGEARVMARHLEHLADVIDLAS